MEIERKWKIDRFPDKKADREAEMWQGYLSLYPEVRIRKTRKGDEYTYRLGVKSEGSLCRTEVEPYITEEDYEALCAMLEKPPVHKEWRGYELPGGLLLEVSCVDGGEPTSFMYAEVEFPDVETAERFIAPDYLGPEMTGNNGFRMKQYWAHRLDRNAPFVLASASPRRRELLTQVGLEFEVITSDADETLEKGTAPADAVLLLSERKADAVVPQAGGRVVIAADTVVALDGEIFGKPADSDDAKRMLKALSGRTHSVFTGVCVVFPDGRKERFYEETKVTFVPLTEEMTEEYIATGEPFGKAGAYAIQGRGARLVNRIEGDYANVVGLPVRRVMEAIGR